MNTRYRHREQVAREMAGIWQALGILFEYAWSMPRVCLEYAYSMPRVCLEYAYSMPGVCLGVSQSEVSGLPVRSKRTSIPKEADSHSEVSGLHTLRYAACVMMVMIGVNLWGQTNITSVSQITSSDGDYVITQDTDS